MSLAITSERLQLRPFREKDVADLHHLWTDSEVRRYLWDNEIISLDLAATAVHSSIESFNQQGFGQWCVRLSGCDKLIGFCGFRRMDDSAEIELLYGLAPEAWGQGLATEAAIAVLQYGFEVCKFEQVFAGIDQANVASLGVAERLGMKFHKTVQTTLGTGLLYVVEREDFLSNIKHDS